MTRVASLYLPQLPIERLRRVARPFAPPEPRPASLALEPPIDDDPGECSVPRGGGWRPGARWAHDATSNRAQISQQIAELPAHQRPPTRMLGRRSEAAEHPFKAMRSNDVGRSGASGAPPSDVSRRPTVLIERLGQRDLIFAACPVALSLGLVPGMAAAHARALVSDLEVRDAEPDADRAWLERLALHGALHWTPGASVDGPNGLWLDLTGTTHLFGGEQRFCQRLLRFLARLGITARVAIAGTPGAAHALARYGGKHIALIETGTEASALRALPTVALRLETSALAAAARFGLDRIDDLIRLPRGPLARRLGLATVRRLDQALGQISEPIVPVTPVEMPSVSRRLVEPIGTAESIAQVTADLIDDLMPILRERGLGARRLVLAAERVDSERQRLVIGTSRATRDAKHLKRMFVLKLERIEPGLGIEAMRLSVPHAEPLGSTAIGSLIVSEGAVPDLAPAVDQMVGRAGSAAVFRMAPRESDVPERAVRRADPLDVPAGWPSWKRPARLLARPERLSNVVALLPDHPPRRFTWRGMPYKVVAGDGPERIHGEWWRSERELWATRDYFRVEVEGGQRFWVFRRGDGIDAETGDLSWHLHGLFG